ncbi:MAG: BamA/TamA family outer membrane protein [Calditrichota bacterium]
MASKHATWLTENMRAHRPVVTADGKHVIFVAGPGKTPNLYCVDIGGHQVRKLTSFTGEVEVNDPDLSPAGNQIAFMFQDTTGNVDIAVMDTSGRGFRKLTNDPAVDLLPVWSRDGRRIFFTSYRNSTPNLYRIAVTAGDTLYQMTDVTGGVFTRQLMPKTQDILATTLPDVDTTRLVLIHPERTVASIPLVLRDRYRDWRSKKPVPSLRHSRYDRPPEPTWRIHRYQPWHDPRHMGSLAFPTPIGVAGFSAWDDPLGKRFLFAGGVLSFPPFSHGVLNHYWVVYNTTAFRPILTMGILKHAAFELQPYDHGVLVEDRTGGFIQGLISFNAGRSLYSNHRVNAGIYLWDNEASLFGTPEGKRPTPQSGEMGIASLGYRWLSRKPNTQNSVFPTQGMGFILQADFANKDIFGQYSYNEWEADAFMNQRICGPVILYARGGYSTIHGNYPPQQELAITDDVSLYVNGRIPGYLLPQPFLQTRENFNLRGNNQVVNGSRLMYWTAELRVPLLSGLPVDLFRIKAGRITGAPFVDSGMIWSSEGTRQITTAGAEIRMAVNFQNVTLFSLGYGWGETLPATGDWHSFLRLALTNPF